MKHITNPWILFLVLAVFFTQGLGYRHLWQDEMETAERSKSILNEGIPKIFDSYQTVSLNSSGREIEDGPYHRYSPWGQFYWGALGLKIGQILNLSSDYALRLPFAMAHAASSSVIIHLLNLSLPFSPWISLGLGTLYSVTSVRLVHHRTARYHSLLDLFFALGLLALFQIFRSNIKSYWYLLALCIFILPQIHTLGGSLLSSFLGVISLVIQPKFRVSKQHIYYMVIPGILSFIIILFLVRPWMQAAWGEFGSNRFRSLLKDFEFIKYSIYIYAISLILLFKFKEKTNLKKLLLLGLYIFVMVRILDLHPFSQSRYYLALTHWFIFAICLLPINSLKVKKYWLMATTALILSTEVTPRFPFYQGIRVLVHDTLTSRSQKPQALIEATNFIKNNFPPHTPVFIDYVPQYVNWYLPQYPVALMPDLSGQTELNKNNPIWEKKILMPQLQILHTGFLHMWNCQDQCNYQNREINLEQRTYTLFSKRLQQSQKMCMIKTWSANHWNNAPFSQLVFEPLKANGLPSGELILAQKCDDLPK